MSDRPGPRLHSRPIGFSLQSESNSSDSNLRMSPAWSCSLHCVVCTQYCVFRVVWSMRTAARAHTNVPVNVQLYILPTSPPSKTQLPSRTSPTVQCCCSNQFDHDEASSTPCGNCPSPPICCQARARHNNMATLRPLTCRA